MHCPVLELLHSPVGLADLFWDSNPVWLHFALVKGEFASGQLIHNKVDLRGHYSKFSQIAIVNIKRL